MPSRRQRGETQHMEFLLGNPDLVAVILRGETLVGVLHSHLAGGCLVELVDHYLAQLEDV